jgi:protein phosphatase
MLRIAEHFEKSDTGRQRRANEDSYFVRSPIFVVADGMGGAQAGEVASKIAVEGFEEQLASDDSGSVEQLLAERARDANKRIYQLARSDAARTGMGTTLTVAYLSDEGLSIAHVGDSRAYVWRDGRLSLLTEDHSLVAELVKSGKLTPEEAVDHPQRSIITRALGPDAHVDVDTLTYRARAGDVFLLCSDGLTSMISDDVVEEVLRANDDLPAAGNALIAAANEAGGRDNITVVLFRVEEVGATDDRDDDQPTNAGQSGPTTGEVRQAVREATVISSAAEPARGATRVSPPERRSDATQAPPPPARAQGPMTTVRRRPSAPPEPSSRRRRVLVPVLVSLVVLGLVATGAWIASQTVYFLGTNEQGLVTVFRGVPYELPGGLELYSANFVSGVAYGQLPRARRRSLLDHKLRSHDDARDLVRRLELGQLAAG